ncbi:MAG TPA: EamA family transporter [Candidatus Methylomirabilis sp.]|nr:EamA family transporter [Candidatus Methylomirabilis sp.]
MLIGLVFISLASISWGTTGAIMATLASETGIGPALVGWYRLAVAAPFLLLAAAAGELLARRPVGRVSAGLVEAAVAPTAGGRVSHVTLGLAMAAYQVCYFRAVTLTGVAVAALIAICSAPLLISGLAALFLGERLTGRVRMALAMAVVGTGLLVAGPRGLRAIPGHFWLGALLALGAGLSYAVYAVTAKAVVARMAPLRVAALTFTMAAVFLAPILLGERAPLRMLAAGWPLLLYLGLGPTAIAYVLFTAGLRRVPASVAGIVSLLEPLTASALGVIAFGESLGPLGLTGAGLLLVSLALLATARSRPA